MTLFWAEIFFKNIVRELILWRTLLNFPTPKIPSPFLIVLVMIWMLKFFYHCILSVHADNSFAIPAQSEFVVVGRLSSMPKSVNTSASEIYGFASPLLSFWNVRARKGF